MTVVTAGLIDRGVADYMLETAILKVYSTEALWTIVNDAFQILGGAAYFTDRPLERIRARADRPHRRRSERSADVVHRAGGDAGPGEEFRSVRDSLAHPLAQRAAIGRFLAGAVPRLWHLPRLKTRSPELIPHAPRLGAPRA